MDAIFESPETSSDGLLSRKEVRSLLRQVSIGIGAMLLAAVDDWNARREAHGGRLRTEIDTLLHGTNIAGMAAAGTKTWLTTEGKHPPRHMVVLRPEWPAVSSHGQVFLVIHHNLLRPTNPRRAALCAQDTTLEDLPGDPTVCELTWEYNPTRTHIVRIWISAPGADWKPIEVPMKKAQAQYATWRKRGMAWLPGTGGAPGPATSAIHPQPRGQDDLRPGIAVPPNPDTGDDAADAR